MNAMGIAAAVLGLGLPAALRQQSLVDKSEPAVRTKWDTMLAAQYSENAPTGYDALSVRPVAVPVLRAGYAGGRSTDNFVLVYC